MILLVTLSKLPLDPLIVFPNQFVYFSYFQYNHTQYQIPMSTGPVGSFTNWYFHSTQCLVHIVDKNMNLLQF